MPIVKNSGFFTRRRRGIEKKFWRSVFCLSATAYKEHQICTQKAWIISGYVLAVPFGGKRPQKITEPQLGPLNPQNFSISKKIVFYSASDTEKKFADFEIRQKLTEIIS